MALLSSPRLRNMRSLVALSGPLVVGNMLGIVTEFTDAIMLGWYDTAALAAITVAINLIFILFLPILGFSYAVMSLAAADIARADRDGARAHVMMGVLISVAFGLVLLPILHFAEEILIFAGQPPEIAALAQSYLTLFSIGILPAIFASVLRAFLTAAEYARIVLWGAIIVATANVGLNYVMIFGNFGFPELGIVGAAISSIIVKLILVAFFLWFCLRRMAEYRLFSTAPRFETAPFRRVFRLGLPIGIALMFEGGQIAVATFMIGWFGEVQLAAHGIAVQIVAFTFIFHGGISDAVTVKTASAFGLQDKHQLAREAQTGLTLIVLVCITALVIFVVFTSGLVDMFLSEGRGNALIVATLAVEILLIAAFFQIFDGVQSLYLGILRGMQDGSVPMGIVGGTYWVLGLSLSYLFGVTFGMAAIGVWLGLVAGMLGAAILLYARYAYLMRAPRWAPGAEPSTGPISGPVSAPDPALI